MGLPLPLATCLSWVGPPSNLGGGSARAVFLLVSHLRIFFSGITQRPVLQEKGPPHAGVLLEPWIKKPPRKF